MGMQMRKKLNKLIVFLVLMFIVVCTFFPYYFMLISSLKNNSEIAAHPFTVTFPLRIENYTSSYQMILQYLKNSVIVTGCTVIGTSIIAVLSAYVFARFEFPGKAFLYMFIL